MTSTSRIWVATLLLLVPACAAKKEEVKLDTDNQKALYGLGTQVAEDLKKRLGFLGLNEEETAVFVAGIGDGFAGKSRVDANDPKQNERLESFRTERVKELLEKEKTEAQAFVDAAAKENGAEKTSSGLVYKELQAGTGPQPTEADTVKVHYHGTLRDGTVFDSSRDRGEPVEFPLNGVIPCWTEALPKMKEGGKAKLTCPASIAYGDNGAPPAIKPGAALAFEVELLSVKKPENGQSTPK